MRWQCLLLLLYKAIMSEASKINHSPQELFVVGVPTVWMWQSNTMLSSASPKLQIQPPHWATFSVTVAESYEGGTTIAFLRHYTKYNSCMHIPFTASDGWFTCYCCRSSYCSTTATYHVTTICLP